MSYSRKRWEWNLAGVPVCGCICIFVSLSCDLSMISRYGRKLLCSGVASGTCQQSVSLLQHQKCSLLKASLCGCHVVYLYCLLHNNSTDVFKRCIFPSVCWKRPCPGEEWRLQIHQTKAMQDKGRCKIEVFLWESSHTRGAVSLTSFLCKKKKKKKKKEILAALKAPYSNAASSRGRLIFPLSCWCHGFSIVGLWWCDGPHALSLH